jgi:hypothetical protein
MFDTSTIQAIASIAGLILGATYIIGGLIISLHLSRYGVSDYQIVRVKYLVVGLTYLANAVAILALTALPSFLAIALEQFYQQSLLVVSLGASLGLLWLWSRPATAGMNHQWKLWVALGTFATCFPLMVIIRQMIAPEITFYTGFLIAEGVLAGILSALGQVYYYARYLYANDQTFLGAADPIGSGTPISIQLAGDEANITHLAHLGVSTVRPGLTEKLLLLDETESHYIIGITRDKKTRAIKVTKDVVKAILYLD